MGDGVWVSTSWFSFVPFYHTSAYPSFGSEATAQSADKSLRSLQGKSETSTNASRDVHQFVMNSMGYSLPIPIETLDVDCGGEPTTTYYIKPEHWVQHWMNEQPELLTGFSGNPQENCRAFWKCYQVHQPGHYIFEKHAGRLDQVIPIILHGDEGRAVKRTNYLVLSLESPLGSLDDPTTKCTCDQSLAGRAGLPSYGCDIGAVSEEFVTACGKQSTNYKGHSYLAHWLLFGMGGWIYKRFPHVVDSLVSRIAASLKTLFEDGVSTNRGQIYAALIGVKGDLDFHKKLMYLERCYANVGTVRNISCCHLCMAGKEGVCFEDYAETPEWIRTMGLERPWSTEDPPSMASVPYDESFPENLLQLDLFHVLKVGVARDIIGGVLVFLLRLGFFDDEDDYVNLDARFERAYKHFRLWCLTVQKSPGLRSFSKHFFNMKTLISAPWCSSKGSDSMLLLEWLRHVLEIQIQNPTVQGHTALLKVMLQVVQAALSLRMLAKHKLWLPRSCAKTFYVHVMTLLRGYAVLGKKSIDLKIRAFLQKPKHHSLHHLAIFVKMELEKGAPLILSPQAFACEMNEDFMGRISRLSRRVGFKLCDLRVIHRYFIKVKVLLKKRLDKRTNKVRSVWCKKWRPK